MQFMYARKPLRKIQLREIFQSHKASIEMQDDKAEFIQRNEWMV